MRLLFSICSILIIFVLGCSGGSSPVLPDDSPSPELSKAAVNDGSGRILWGIWDVRINPDTMTAEVTPLREASFTANVTRFMQPPLSPVHMVSFSIRPASDPAIGYFNVDVALRHPFPGLNMYNGFDVRGILLSDGSITGDHDSGVLRAGEDDTHLANADGYTRWWNYQEFTSYESMFGATRGKLAPPNQPTATVNPYKYFALGLDPRSPVTDLDFSGRGFFPTVPGVHTRNYEIYFKMDGPQVVFDFQYAVDASWEEPDPSYEPEYPQDAFSLNANCREAFNLSVSDAGSTAYYIDPTDNGGEVVLDIEVYDWQSMENPDGVPGEVSGLWLEGDILGGAVDVLPSATILPGSSIVSSVYEVTLGSLNLTRAGVETLFCTVENASPDSYEPQIPGGSGFSYPSAHLAAYFTVETVISGEAPGVEPTVLSIDPDWGYVDEIYTDVLITGEDFDPACTVRLEFEPGIVINGENVEWIDETSIEADFDLTGAELGLYDVIVTNAPGYEGSLEEGFEVKEYVPAIWPTTQGNIANTGYVEGLSGPSGTHGAPTWTVQYTDCDKGNSLPVFVSDDTAFFTIAYNYLDTNHLPAVAVDLDTHTVKWTKIINYDSHSSLVVKGISEDGSVVLVRDWPSSNSYGLDADDGEVLWDGPGIAGSDSYATHDLDGNFIVSVNDLGIRSIDPSDGSVNWTAYIGDPGPCTPAVGPDGTIYAYSNWLSNAQVHALDPETGANNWSSYPAIGRCDNGITVHPDTGDIIVHGQGGLHSFTDNGSTWSINWVQYYTYPWFTSVAIDPDGYIIMFDGAPTLRRLDPDDGSTVDSNSGYEEYATRPAIGDDGLIYANSNNSMYGSFCCFNSDLSLKWIHYGSGGGINVYFSAPAIGQDGTVYSSRRHLGLCAWHD